MCHKLGGCGPKLLPKSMHDCRGADGQFEDKFHAWGARPSESLLAELSKSAYKVRGWC